MTHAKPMLLLTALTITPIVGLVGLLFTNKQPELFLLLVWLPFVSAVGFALYQHKN